MMLGLVLEGVCQTEQGVEWAAWHRPGSSPDWGECEVPDAAGVQTG